MALCSPIPYDSMSPGQLRLMLLMIAVTCGVLATLAVLSWVRLPRPRPRLASYAAVAHLLWLTTMLAFAVACLITAVTAYSS